MNDRRGAPVAIIGNITAQDDFNHEVEEVSNFNESFLFHFAGLADSGELVGGLIRVANRPNEGFSECTVLVWLPDGSAIFNFERAPNVCNEGWSVSHWEMEVIEPGGRQFRTNYSGPALHLRDPRVLRNPRHAWESPKTHLDLRLDHFGKGPLTEFKHHLPMVTAEQKAAERERYGTSALHQFMRFEGSLEIAGQLPLRVSGHGWRDHSWGARNWQGFTDHIMLTANFDDEEGICLFSTIDGCGYAFHRGRDQILGIVEAKIDVGYTEDGQEPLSLGAYYRLDDGTEGRFRGAQRGYVPLRNHKNQLETSIGYSLWEYHHDDGRQCFGLGEFLSQRAYRPDPRSKD